MLAEIRPLLTEQVEHAFASKRDIYGKRYNTRRSTSHPARVAYMPGRKLGPASQETMADAKATIWLLNHPRPIAVGDTFKLPSGETLAVIAAEHRLSGSYTVSKVFLS